MKKGTRRLQEVEKQIIKSFYKHEDVYQLADRLGRSPETIRAYLRAERLIPPGRKYKAKCYKPKTLSPVVIREPEPVKKEVQINHPDHYNAYDIEAVEMVNRIYKDYNGSFMVAFCEATALLYRLRMGRKPENSVEQEMGKEAWWLSKRDEFKLLAEGE